MNFLSSEYIELTIFSLNNISNYIKSIEALIDCDQFGHGAGLGIFAIEEFIRSMNFYILAVGDMYPDEAKKIKASNNKTSTGNLASKFDEAIVISLQIILSRWLQAKPESFEIFANYITAKTDFEKETFLSVMIEYLKGDASDYAVTFNSLLALKQEVHESFNKVKHDHYLRIDKNNTLPITTDIAEADEFLSVCKLLDNFSDNVSEFLRELFLNKELFKKYKKFDNNVRNIWPDIFKHF